MGCFDFFIPVYKVEGRKQGHKIRAEISQIWHQRKIQGQEWSLSVPAWWRSSGEVFKMLGFLECSY